MFLVDRELKKVLQEDSVRISVDEDTCPPFDPLTQIGPSSIDLRLGRVFRKYKQQVGEIDLTQKDETELIEVPPDKEFVIGPGEFFLGVTVETIHLPTNIAGIISSRSSIARLGLSVVSQILMHPGHSQAVALQLGNMTDRPIKIKPLLPICQIMLLHNTSHAEKPYHGKYINESKFPLSSGIGVELGLEKAEQISKSTETTKFQEKQKHSIYHKKSISLMTAFFLLVIAGCFPIIIQEFPVQPFPSSAFTISSILVLFCATCLALNWLEERKKED